MPAPGAPVWVPPTSGDQGSRVAELARHHALACVASPGTRAVFRHLVFQVAGTLAGASLDRRSALHDPSDYGPAYARRVRAARLEGVHYRSARHPKGRCLAVIENRTVRFLQAETGAVVLE